jgi:hypothetical protein
MDSATCRPIVKAGIIPIVEAEIVLFSILLKVGNPRKG